MPKRLYLRSNHTQFHSEQPITPTHHYIDQPFIVEKTQSQLNQQSHIFVVLLGAVLGGIIALAMGYSMEASLVHYLTLAFIPVLASFVLRKVYIYTLIHYKD